MPVQVDLWLEPAQECAQGLEAGVHLGAARARDRARRGVRGPEAGVGERVVAVLDYRERVPIAGTTPEALAQAWSEALGRVLASLVRELAAAELTPK